MGAGKRMATGDSKQAKVEGDISTLTGYPIFLSSVASRDFLPIANALPIRDASLPGFWTKLGKSCFRTAVS